jgi:xanthine dehydrogenase molybdopterin-binding subunit B
LGTIESPDGFRVGADRRANIDVRQQQAEAGASRVLDDVGEGGRRRDRAAAGQIKGAFVQGMGWLTSEEL